MALAAGANVDGYEVLGLLGAGGMGEVYRARDPILKREVAIKVLPPFVAKDPDRLWRFEQEAQAAAALNHPNILAVYRFGVFEGAPYLVSELLVGETLRQQLSHGPLSLRRAIDLAVQIAHGLAAAHDKGIVHRDLKPENLFVTKEGRIKILDFGLAKLTQPQADKDESAPTQTFETDPGSKMGTAGYMSPEMVRGKLVDHRADIFAFGAVLYEMLTGRRAFQHSTSAETMTAILHEDPPSVSQIARNAPPGLQRVVHRCLEKNAERRFQSSSDLAFALEALSESGISSSAAVQGPEQRRQRKALAWWIGLAAMVAAAIATYYFAAHRGQAPFAHYSLRRVIDSKHVVSLAISPDGIYLAAVLHDANGAQTLLLHHIPTRPSPRCPVIASMELSLIPQCIEGTQMTRRLMTMIVVIFLSTISSPAQRSEKPDLQVIATAISKQAYNAELSVRLLNQSGHPLRIPVRGFLCADRPGWVSIRYTFTPPANHPEADSGPRGCGISIGEPAENDIVSAAGMWKLLQPGESVEIHGEFSKLVPGSVKPGSYRIRAVYTGPEETEDRRGRLAAAGIATAFGPYGSDQVVLNIQ